MKVSKILIAIVFSVLLTSNSVLAEYWVYDPTAVAKQAEILAQNVKQVQAAYDQINNQMKMLENMAKNITALPQEVADSVMNDVGKNLEALINLQQDVKGMSVDYHKVQNDWKKTFPDFQDAAGMSIDDYNKQWDQMIQTTSDSVYDAMRTQGLTAQIGDDARNLQKLLNASQTAPGLLAAVQAGNQIAAQNAQQLMRLEQMMASYNAAQLQYMQIEMENKKKQQAEMEKMLKAHQKKVDDMMNFE